MDTNERGLTMEKPYRYRKKLILSGGSLVMIVPNEWIVEQDLTNGSEVSLEVFDDRIEIRPAK